MNIEAHINPCQMMDQLPLEVVERKGIGHPDTICDLIVEKISFDLGRYYQEACGQVLHYNVDKALLVGGQSQPSFRGGKILKPAKLYIGDRAINFYSGKKLELTEVIEKSIQSWLRENLKHLRLGETLEWQSELRPGSATLSTVEGKRVSNDTSVGIGSWPFSAVERLVFVAESFLASLKYREKFPQLGEDIKIMAVRRNRSIELILANAIVDRYISDTKDYFDKKETVLQDLKRDLSEYFGNDFEMSICLNALDDRNQELAGLYMTVTGLSCEGGDSGQVGRGNRINGLISFMRSQTMEAWAGKNFKTHVGKIYSFAAQRLAKQLVEEIDEVDEATVTLVGKIGSPVQEPPYVFADFKMKNGNRNSVENKVRENLKNAITAKNIFEPQSPFSFGNEVLSGVQNG